jgi:hypothetical protein
MDGRSTSPSMARFERSRAPWAPWPLAWGSSSSPYRSPNSDPILPMQSRLREELVLPTYSSETGPQKVVNGEAAWAAFGDGEVFLWLSSSFQEVVQRLPRGLLLLLGQFNGSNRRWIAQIWWRLGFSRFWALRAKICTMGCTIYRGFWIGS